MGERGRKHLFAEFDLDQKPRLAVAHHHKVHFPLLLVSQIAQLEVSEAQVGPGFDRLEQMAGNKILSARAIFGYTAPVAKKPLRFGQSKGWLF